MTYDDLFVLVKKHVDDGKTYDKSKDDVREELLAYYSTVEGREELMNSPHNKLKPEQAVALLMQDVYGIIRRQIQFRDRGDQ
jgi:hypothetical protein